LELQISRISLSDTSRSEATLTHRGQQIDFNVSDYKNIVAKLEHDVFGEINAYWARLPMDVQDQIFALYCDIKNTFLEYPSNEQLMFKLYDLVAKLADLHPLENIKHWMDFYGQIFYPPDLKEVFVEYHMPGSAAGTYLREDYTWLVAVSIALRPLLPVWGEFIAYIKEDFGPNWKEYFAYQLLARSNLTKSAPMERLRLYVRAQLGSDKKVDISNSGHILHGNVSVEDYPEWMLGLVLVRKLIISDVKGREPRAHLASQMFSFIKHKTKQRSDNGFSQIVREKKVEGQASSDDNQQSKLESCKVKASIAEGKIAPILFYAREMRRIALTIAPDLPLELLDASFESVKQLANVVQTKQQEVLVMYVLNYSGPQRQNDFSEYFPQGSASIYRGQMRPQGLHYFYKTSKLEATAVAQAIYWHKGFPELAALVSAIPRPSYDEHTASEGGPRQRLSQQTIEELNKWYPYPRPQGGKQKTQRLPSPAEVSIDVMDKGLSEHAWMLTLPPAWVAAIKHTPNDRSYGVPGNFKVKLAQLAIALASRSF
jgi:hypothetical protein